MEIVKSMLGGLIGGAVGAYVANLIQSVSGLSSPVFLLITGLGAGIGVRVAAGMNRSFATGVVGVVTTVIILLGSVLASEVAEVRRAAEEVKVTQVPKSTTATDPDMVESSDVATSEGDAATESAETGDEDNEEQTSADAESPATEPADAEPEDDAPEPTDEQAAREATAKASEATVPQAAPVAGATEGLADRLGWSLVDFLFNGGAALLAFVLSTGSGSSKSESAA